jgi:predicted transglutaminase-like cysteine proteinase
MNLIDQVRLQIETPKYNVNQRVKLRTWLKNIGSLANSKSKIDVLNGINSFFNSHKLCTEAEWADPISVVSSGSGSADSIAIAKYITAHMCGISPARLVLAYVQQTHKASHLVVLFKKTPSAEPLVMDYYNGSIMPLSSMVDISLTNVMVFNMKETFRWNDTRGIQLVRTGHSENIPQWKKVLKNFGIQFNEYHEPILL